VKGCTNQSCVAALLDTPPLSEAAEPATHELRETKGKVSAREDARCAGLEVMRANEVTCRVTIGRMVRLCAAPTALRA